MDDGVGTKEVICGASKYKNFLSGGCIKVVESMVYGMLYKDQGLEDRFQYSISLSSRSLGSLHHPAYLHDIFSIGGRFYVDGR